MSLIFFSDKRRSKMLSLLKTVRYFFVKEIQITFKKFIALITFTFFNQKSCVEMADRLLSQKKVYTNYLKPFLYSSHHLFAK